MPSPALAQYGHREGDARWWFTTSGRTYTEADAERIVAACQSLGVDPPTDLIRPVVWLAMVDRIVALERAVTDLAGKLKAIK